MLRAWINFIRDISPGRTIAFEECTPDVVGQINMIPNFRGQANVRSVYAAYVCDGCGHSKWELFEAGKNLPSSSEAEIAEQTCNKCGEAMEMEELEEEFFSWLDSA